MGPVVNVRWLVHPVGDPVVGVNVTEAARPVPLCKITRPLMVPVGEAFGGTKLPPGAATTRAMLGMPLA